MLVTKDLAFYMSLYINRNVSHYRPSLLYVILLIGILVTIDLAYYMSLYINRSVSH